MEECQSSESGWTMYLGSLTNGDDNDGGSKSSRDRESGPGKNRDHRREDEDSDDSMASDASSGPSYRELHGLLGTGEEEGGRVLLHGCKDDAAKLGRRKKEEEKKKVDEEDEKSKLMRMMKKKKGINLLKGKRN